MGMLHSPCKVRLSNWSLSGKIKQLTEKPNQKFAVLNAETHRDALLDSWILLTKGLTCQE